MAGISPFRMSAGRWSQRFTSPWTLTSTKYPPASFSEVKLTWLGSWWGDQTYTIILKVPVATHVAELIRYGFRASWGLEWPGLSRAYRRWSLALGGFPLTRMLHHGRLQGAGGRTVCVSLRLIISFC